MLLLNKTVFIQAIFDLVYVSSEHTLYFSVAHASRLSVSYYVPVVPNFLEKMINNQQQINYDVFAPY